MANDPVYITFEFRGNLEDEVEKVTLGIKGLRDESAKTYQRLIADSGAAYGSMSAENRKLAVTVQENINASFTSMGVACWFCSTAEGQYTYWTVTFN